MKSLAAQPSPAVGTVLIQNRILEMIARGDSLGTIQETLVQIVEEYTAPAVCTVYFVDPSGKPILAGSAPGLPNKLLKALGKVKVKPRAGDMAARAFKNETMKSKDLEPGNDAALAHQHPLKRGFRASWFTPISNPAGKVLGTLCLYYREPRQPSLEEKEILQAAARVAGIAIERHLAEDELKESWSRLKGLVDERTLQLTEAIRQLQDEIVQRKN
ncbi:MAG: GAF domain-containing protein, partial [Nitrospinaceae bacterium]